jgi:cytochrome c oxidase cbb3-type subunit 3
MGIFWNVWIIGLTSINLILIVWVLLANRKVAIRDDADPENRTTGHVYDGIEEFDNPLPKWWFMLFILTIVFAIFYLILYPGLGSYKGLLGWTSTNQLKNEQTIASAKHQETYGVYMQTSAKELVDEPRAMKMAQRVFANNCAVCHGADGSGYLGFPNLTDKDWLYGGSPEKIKETLIYGRQAAMPAWQAVMGTKGIADVTEYVLSLNSSEREYDVAKAVLGEKLYTQNCSACHGAEAKGQHALGAPNLTDDIWLYDGSAAGIRQTLRMGRNGKMPAQAERLREEKIHLLTAYVYSLSLGD